MSIRKDEKHYTDPVLRRDGRVEYTCPTCGRKFDNFKDFANHKHYDQREHYPGSKPKMREQFPAFRELIDEKLGSYGAYRGDVRVALDELVKNGTHFAGGQYYYICPIDHSEFSAKDILEYHILTRHKDLLEKVLTRALERDSGGDDAKKASLTQGRNIFLGYYKPMEDLFISANTITKKRGDKEIVIRECPLDDTLFKNNEQFEKHVELRHGGKQLFVWLDNNLEGAAKLNFDMGLGKVLHEIERKSGFNFNIEWKNLGKQDLSKFRYTDKNGKTFWFDPYARKRYYDFELFRETLQRYKDADDYNALEVIIPFRHDMYHDESYEVQNRDKDRVLREYVAPEPNSSNIHRFSNGKRVDDK